MIIFMWSGERVNDITFWKEELIAEIRAMENETDNLQVKHTTNLQIDSHFKR